MSVETDRMVALDALKSLPSLANLPVNWDGYGAEPITPECVAHVRVILATLPEYAPSPEMFPNPNGTITLEWETDKGIASVEVGNTHISSFIEIDGDTQYFHEAHTQKLPEFLRSALVELYTSSQDAQ